MPPGSRLEWAKLKDDTAAKTAALQSRAVEALSKLSQGTPVEWKLTVVSIKSVEEREVATVLIDSEDRAATSGGTAVRVRAATHTSLQGHAVEHTTYLCEGAVGSASVSTATGKRMEKGKTAAVRIDLEDGAATSDGIAAQVCAATDTSLRCHSVEHTTCLGERTVRNAPVEPAATK